jgi:hypothetical protein
MILYVSSFEEFCSAVLVKTRWYSLTLLVKKIDGSGSQKYIVVVDGDT